MVDLHMKVKLEEDNGDTKVKQEAGHAHEKNNDPHECVCTELLDGLALLLNSK